MSRAWRADLEILLPLTKIQTLNESLKKRGFRVTSLTPSNIIYSQPVLEDWWYRSGWCRRGDSVMISSSIPQNVRQAMKELRAEVCFLYKALQHHVCRLPCNVIWRAFYKWRAYLILEMCVGLIRWRRQYHQCMPSTANFLCLQVGDQAALSGLECNVSSPGAVTRLANAAASQMGSIDVWINNAGYSGRYQASLSRCVSHTWSL